ADGKNCAEMTDPEYGDWWKVASENFYQAGGKIYQQGVTGLNPLGTVSYMGSDKLFAVAQGAQLAEGPVNALAIGTGIVGGGVALSGGVAGAAAIESLGAIPITSGGAATS